MDNHLAHGCPPKLLEEGERFSDVWGAYHVYWYDLKGKGRRRKIYSDSGGIDLFLQMPKRHKVFSRLDPEQIAHEGKPGDGVLIARKAGNKIGFSLGYIKSGWVLVLVLGAPCKWAYARDWMPSASVGLNATEFDWLFSRVDIETLVERHHWEREKLLRERAIVLGLEKGRATKRAIAAKRREQARLRHRAWYEYSSRVLEDLNIVVVGLKELKRLQCL